MTVKEMSQLRCLSKEIEQLKKQREDLEYILRDLSSTKDCVKGSDKELFILHNVTVTGIAINDQRKWLECKAELEDIKKLLELNSSKLIYEYNRLNRYIQDCEDSLTRQILTFRFINGLQWGQVADSIGGSNTGGSVKKIAYRYLNKK